MQYLPFSKHGSILITTRNRNAALQMVHDSNVMTVEPMDEGEALALFSTKLGALASNTDYADLAAALEYMPLALIQAAAYIKKRQERCSVRQYLEEFRRGERAQKRLLKHETANLYRDWDAKNSILLTWQISFKHILNERPSAADLLSLMSFCDRHGIPEFLVRGQGDAGKVAEESGLAEQVQKIDLDNSESESESESESKASDDDRFEADLLMLRQFSFVALTTDATIFDMHSLVQLATRIWLKDEDQLEKCREKHISNLYVVLPVGTLENWTVCQSLFPHVKAILGQKPQSEESQKEWSHILHRAAWYAVERGIPADAEHIAAKAMKTRTELFGPHSAQAMSSLAMTAAAYRLQGQFKEAENLQLQALAISNKLNDGFNIDTLTLMDNLANTYQLQGRFKEAEKLNLQIVPVKRILLGPGHPSTLSSTHSLAATYQYQGQWKDAEVYNELILKERELLLGKEHLQTLSSLSSLASTYYKQQRFKEAEQLQARVVETRTRLLGKEHPDTLSINSDLAATYVAQEQYEEAERLALQVAEAEKRLFGEEHPSSLNILGNLAAIYFSQGRWEEAEPLFVQVLDMKKRVLGLEHPDTLSGMNNMAWCLKKLKRHKEARDLLTECYNIRLRTFGPNYPHTVQTAAVLEIWGWDEERTDFM